MEEKDTYLKPSVHGWSFQNGFDFNGNIAEFLEQRGLLGLTIAEFILLPRISKLILIVILGVRLDDEYGFCGGMTWAALDRFYRGENLPRNQDLPVQGETLYNELKSRLIDSLPFDYILDMYDMQKADDTEASNITKTHWQLFVKPKLDFGLPVPLCLIYTKDSKVSTLFKNHQVIAYKYQLEDNGNLTIWIYDPNGPDDNNARINMKIAPGSNINATHTVYSISKELRGFLNSPYDRIEILPTVNLLEKDESIGEGGYVLSHRSREGADVLEKYKIKFKWESNFIPYYTILVDGTIYSDMSNISCELTNGSKEIDVVISHLVTDTSNHKITVQLVNKKIEYEIEIPTPSLELDLFMQEGRDPVFSLDVPENAIIDANLHEVSVVEPDSDPYSNSITDSTILEAYQNKRIFVDGGLDPDANPNAFNAQILFRTVRKLGYITAPHKIHCKFQASGFYGEFDFKGSLHKVYPHTKRVERLRDFEFFSRSESFELNEGFNRTDYDQEVYYRFQYKGSDDLGQIVSGELNIYAKSLLHIEIVDYAQSNIYEQPEWGLIRNSLVEEINTEVISFVKDRVGSRIDLSEAMKFVNKRINENLDALINNQEEWTGIHELNLKNLSDIRKMAMRTLATSRNKKKITKIHLLHEKLHNGTISMNNFKLLRKKLSEKIQNKPLFREVKKTILKK